MMQIGGFEGERLICVKKCQEMWNHVIIADKRVRLGLYWLQLGGCMEFLLVFFGHWYLSLFTQTFFLHRYAAHRMFTMNKFWERFFYGLTFVAQGTSFLNPRAYAYLHRMHHAWSDTEKDPHSPRNSKNVMDMMMKTYRRYDDLLHRREEIDNVAKGYVPEWSLLDKMANKWYTLALFGVLYAVVYYFFAPSPWFFALVPLHLIMGPMHGAIVNWAGHRYGYRNFKDTGDDSRNTFRWDIVSLGELFQNNHHKDGSRVNFAMGRLELDPTFLAIKVLSWMKIVHINASAMKVSPLVLKKNKNLDKAALNEASEEEFRKAA